MQYIALLIILLAPLTLLAEGEVAQNDAISSNAGEKEKSSKKEATASTNEVVIFDQYLPPVATTSILESVATGITEMGAKFKKVQSERTDERILVQCCEEQRVFEPLMKELNLLLTNSTNTVTLGKGFQQLVVTYSTPGATETQEVETISVFLRDGEVVDRFRDAKDYDLIGFYIGNIGKHTNTPVMHYTVRSKDIPVVESKDLVLKFAGLAGKNIWKISGFPPITGSTIITQKVPVYAYAKLIQFKARDAVLSTSAIFYPASEANTSNVGSAALSIALSNKIESLKRATISLANSNEDVALAEFAKAKEYQALADALKENHDMIVEPRNSARIGQVSALIQSRTTEQFNFGLAYAIKDHDQLTYDKDNGIVTAKEDSKTPAFLTINYFPGGVEKRIKDADLDKSLPAPLWTPFHLMAGFRTDITDGFEPMVGAGVGIRVLEASLNVWAGVSLQKAEELKNGVEEGAAAPNGGITDDRYDMPFMWGVSISWKP